VPSFYHRSSTEWLSYVMFLLGAEIFRTDLSFAIPLPADFSLYSKGRKWGLNKAKRAVLSIREVQDFHPFWQEVLIPNLWERHGVSPVHCVEEIERLAINNIPYIRQFDVFEGDQLVAGMTVYDCSTTAHALKIAADLKATAPGGLAAPARCRRTSAPPVTPQGWPRTGQASPPTTRDEAGRRRNE